MTPDEILLNAFYSFWYSFGEYFIMICGLVLTYAIVFTLIHILTKK